MQIFVRADLYSANRFTKRSAGIHMDPNGHAWHIGARSKYMEIDLMKSAIVFCEYLSLLYGVSDSDEQSRLDCWQRCSTADSRRVESVLTPILQWVVLGATSGFL